MEGYSVDKAKKPTSALAILGKIYKEKGFRGLYQVRRVWIPQLDRHFELMVY